ncbi:MULTISPECIES: hypothetical protein [Erysipelotrichaceae]|uniref:hypothetical protein n=1 Tax=Erysipelotrichaceae TaxID=128827 RepID=UPI000E515B27|nr:hypothetical protein [Absiella sp. AM27-20]RHU03269.1 hypothetical protein DW716_15725 [Absiella sp. AM27-20]
MIKFEDTEVWGFGHAIRGMRNPLESWDKSDTFTCDDARFQGSEYFIGDNDINLMQRLIKAGSDHRKFMRQIMVSVDITAPLYWWKEFDTYKVGTVANSCSTMHCIHKKEFMLEDFSCEHLIDDGIAVSCGSEWATPNDVMELIIDTLNLCRKKYLETKDKKYWWQMIQLLPSSYNQKRTVTLNYEVLRNIYFARRNHKLDEWSENIMVIEGQEYSQLNAHEGFCDWIKTLPYAKDLIMLED